MSELAKALAAFHKNLPDVHKGSVNPAFKSRYADLADIVKVVLPKLAEHGLAWVARPLLTGEGFVLAYSLTHVSGESVEGTWPLPDPSKAKPQELGSALTYARRYTLSSVTGISPDDDDDGNAASSKGAPRAVKQDNRADRVANATTALQSADSRESVQSVWVNVNRSGLAGDATLISVYKAALDKYPGDDWAVVEPGSVDA